MRWTTFSVDVNLCQMFMQRVAMLIIIVIYCHLVVNIKNSTRYSLISLWGSDWSTTLRFPVCIAL